MAAGAADPRPADAAGGVKEWAGGPPGFSWAMQGALGDFDRSLHTSVAHQAGALVTFPIRNELLAGPVGISLRDGGEPSSMQALIAALGAAADQQGLT
jgi:hypothetical protein